MVGSSAIDICTHDDEASFHTWPSLAIEQRGSDFAMLAEEDLAIKWSQEGDGSVGLSGELLACPILDLESSDHLS